MNKFIPFVFTFLFLNLILISQPFKYTNTLDEGVGFDYLVKGNGDTIVSVYVTGGYSTSPPPFKYLRAYCVSYDGGSSFETFRTFNPNGTSVYDFALSAQYTNNKYLFFHIGGNSLEPFHIYRYNTKLELLDTLNFDHRRKLYPFEQTHNNKYSAMSFYGWRHSDPNSEHDWDLYITDDAFDTFKLIEFKDSILVRRGITDLYLVNNSLFYTIYYNRDTIINNVEILEVEAYEVEYDIINDTFDTTYVTSRLIDGFNCSYIVPISKSKYFLITDNRDLRIFENGKIKMIYENEVKLNSNFINIKRINDNEIIVSENEKFWQCKFWHYNNETEQITYKELNLDGIKKPSQSAYKGDIIYKEETNSILFSFAVTLLLEIFIDDFFFSSVEDIAIDFNPKIYPLPAEVNSIVNLELNKIANKIELYDIKGKIHQVVNEKSNNYTISTNNLSPGIYFVKIYFNGISLTKTLIIN